MLLETLVNAAPAMAKLLSTDLPIKLAFRLGVMIKSVDPILKSYNDERIKLIDRYGEKDEKGNMTVIAANMKLFTDELTEVLQEDITVEGIPEIKVADLPDDTKMTAQEVAALTPWLIKS